MSIQEKITNAKKTNWISEGFSQAEIKTTIELAKISARIERCRLELKMTQKEFADYMGVTQAMVSKWESREYNFTVRSLNEICEKLGLSMSMSLENSSIKNSYVVIEWDKEIPRHTKNKNTWSNYSEVKEAIA